MDNAGRRMKFCLVLLQKQKGCKKHYAFCSPVGVFCFYPFCALIKRLFVCPLLKLKGTGVKLIVLAFFRNQILMGATLNNNTLFKHHNNVRIHYR